MHWYGGIGREEQIKGAPHVVAEARRKEHQQARTHARTKDGHAKGQLISQKDLLEVGGRSRLSSRNNELNAT